MALNMNKVHQSETALFSYKTCVVWDKTPKDYDSINPVGLRLCWKPEAAQWFFFVQSYYLYEWYLYLIQQELSAIAAMSLKRLSAKSKTDLWISFYTKKK